MQFYFRTGRQTGVSVGPLGMLIVAPFYLAVLAFVAFLYLIAIVFLLVVALIRVLRERRGKTTTTPAA